MPAKKKAAAGSGKRKTAKTTGKKRGPGDTASKSKATVTRSKKTQNSTSAGKSARTAGGLKKAPLCIVGIGASAGGLEALEGLFSKMPSASGIAFVVIQHLAPKHESIMGSLLKRYTDMRILQVSDGMKAEPDTIYLNLPDRDVSVMNGVFYLTEPQESHSARLPIDFFFRSLAADQRERAICIILSGTGTDGTLGLKAVKGEGGMTMVQDEKQAKYDSMPRNAVNTGLVDFILPVEKMPPELVKYIRHPYMKSSARIIIPGQEHTNTIKKIFLLIRSGTGHDFSHYKMNTVRRRIERRMAVHQIKKITDYLRYLQENPSEVETLYKDMLITVTNFFRDPDAFELLGRKIIPDLLKKKRPDAPLRIWVPGCATGEEAYSIAMLVHEAMEEFNKHLNIQIFATDIDPEALEFARAGLYPESIAADVSAKRLKRFFTQFDSSYAVKKQIRETVVFAVQNIIKDPPFSKLDMLSCRNVLIYMDSVLQKKILPLFHYVLNNDGVLFLGTSESIGEFSNYFSPVSTKWKVFRRKGIPRDMVEHPTLPLYDKTHELERGDDRKRTAGADVRQMAERLILQDYAPACVLLNEKHEIVYFHGKTEMFLTPPVGEPSFDVLKMAREELRYSLSILIHKAMKDKKMISSEVIPLTFGNQIRNIKLIIRPLADSVPVPGLMMVLFEEETQKKKPAEKERKKEAAVRRDPRISALEQELQSTKEYLRTTIEELETSNEELKSTNEELQSTNEELQSTNEEMETSKEELQSTNEELETVNAELQSKVEELSRANNDLSNLLSSTDIGTIFLDTDLNISRYTPAMTRIFNLIQSDIGRPVGDITSKLAYKDLAKDAKKVLDTLVVKEEETRSVEGAWFSMRIMPYRTVDNVIDGVVITFVDITAARKAQDEIRKAKEFSESIVDTVREPLLVLDSQMRVVSANSSFYRKFQVGPEETENRIIYELGGKQWDIPSLRRLLEEVLPGKRIFQDYIVEHKFPSIGKRKMALNARKLHTEKKEEEMILLAIEDITGQGDEKK